VTVQVRYTKHDRRLHWHFDAERLGADTYGTWLLVPPGSTYRRGTDEPRVEEHGFVLLIPDGGWWSAYFNAVPRGTSATSVYVDINSPAEWDGDVVTMIDLDLDVVRRADGAVALLDEDELADHRVEFAYPDRLVDTIRATAASVFGAIERGDEPFGSAGPARVVTALGWALGSVVTGHGAASGRSGDPRFPGGTLALQSPHFEAAGVDIAGYHRGTINVSLPFRLEPRSPAARIEALEWLPGYPAETFEFFDARIAVDGSVVDAVVYRPDPATKPEFHQDPHTIEVLAPFMGRLEAGSPIAVWVDPNQARFVG
jgi:hypothetical protein